MLIPFSYFLLSVGLLLSMVGQAQTAPNASLAATIKDAKWHKRVLLLCAPSPDDANLRRQQQLLAPAKAELDARHMLVREVVVEQLSAADQSYLRQQLKVKEGAFAVILIGKDGGVKRHETQPLTPEQMFSTIDSMPMRQQEMTRTRQ